MSLQWALSRQVPPDTAAIGQAVLKTDNIFRQIGERFDELFPEEGELAFLYDSQGRGAMPPLLMALVTVFQMLEKVPDRQAAEYVASRIDWKYALHLPLTYTGFHWTDLLAFRKRLWEHRQERLLYDRFLARLQQLGLVKRRGKMRTDSTHVLAVVERLSQLELITETIRVALRAVILTAPAWAEQMLPDTFQEIYSDPQSEYGLSGAEVSKRLQQVGRDGYWFLGQIERLAPPEVQQLPEVDILRTVLQQNYPAGPNKPPAQKRPTGSEVIESPHEPEARGGVKRSLRWTGYKMQVTETCDIGFPPLIVDLEITGALENDAPQLPRIQDRLEARDMLPGEQQADQAYISARLLVSSARRGINLLGIPPADTQGPAGFRQTDFEIDVPAQRATCPAGQVNQVWSEKHGPEGEPPAILVRFAGSVCQACPSFGVCTKSRKGRSLTLHPYRAVLLARRAEAETRAFREQLQLRAGIEGTLSELVRAHGLRQARYRGLVKLRLQGYFTALAVDLKRLARWWPQAQAVT